MTSDGFCYFLYISACYLNSIDFNDLSSFFHQQNQHALDVNELVDQENNCTLKLIYPQEGALVIDPN